MFITIIVNMNVVFFLLIGISKIFSECILTVYKKQIKLKFNYFNFKDTILNIIYKIYK